MIDNQYAFEVDIDLDIEYLKNLALSKTEDIVNGRLHHHQQVSDDAYMSYVRTRFPFLSTSYNIHPVDNLPLHFDADRYCALNIPIINTEHSFTVFYEAIEPLVYNNIPDRHYNEISSKVVEKFTMTLSRPTFIDNSVPHEVINVGKSPRTIISWSVLSQYNLADIKQLMSML